MQQPIRRGVEGNLPFSEFSAGLDTVQVLRLITPCAVNMQL